MPLISSAGLVDFQPWVHSGSSSELDRVQLFVLTVGIVLTALGYSPVIRASQWRARARAATGRVVDHVRLAPVVEFDVGDSHVRFLGPDPGSGPLPLGATVEVLYDPALPDDAHLASDRAHPSRWLIVGMVVVAAGVMATWL